RDPPGPLEVAGLTIKEVQALEQVLARALAKEPTDRFASTADFARALLAARPGASRAWLLQRVAALLLGITAASIVALVVLAPRAEVRPAVVVAKFENLSGDPAQERLCQSATD